MATINLTDIQNLDPATPELFNSRFGLIVNELNGNIDDQNLKNLAVTTGKIANDAVTGAKIQLNSNEALESLNASANAKALLKLHTDGYLRLSQLPRQDDDNNTIANSTRENVLIQYGWVQVTGAAATEIAETVTFPVSYDVAPIVIVCPLGGKTGGTAAANITELVTSSSSAPWVATARSISTTTFSLRLARGSNFTLNDRYGAAWIAIGAKA